MRRGSVIAASFFLMKYVLLILMVLFSLNVYSYDKDTLDALDRTNLFFEEMQNRNYSELWSYLTITSQKKIISDILTHADPKDNLTNEKVAKDFAKCAELCVSYWTGFLYYFDPDLVLEKTEWNISEASPEYVEVELINSETQAQSLLKIYKEKGIWQFGLTESFWIRKFFN